MIVKRKHVEQVQEDAKNMEATLSTEVATVFRRAEPTHTARGRRPQGVDRERYGYDDEPEELLLVRDREGELWIP